MTARPGRVAEMQGIIESWFESAGNLGFDFQGACQASTVQQCGSGAEDIGFRCCSG